MNNQRGAGSLIVIGVIVAILVVGGIIVTQRTTPAEQEVGEVMMEGKSSEDAMMKKIDDEMAMMMKEIGYDYSGDLKDVAGGNASGHAQATFKDGIYSLFVTFDNLPDPEGTDFYEGWIVRKSPFKFISTGKLEKTANDYTNAYSSGDDLTGFDFYVLTLEPDDGNPAPADHILEGTLTMHNDTMMEKEDGAMMNKNAKNEFEGKVLAGNKTVPLLDFVQSDYDTALTSDDLIVLYFYANWCPICKDEVKNGLYPAFDELSKEGVVGFQVNYRDSETNKNEEQLAREFGISSQHTKVFIKNGKRVLKSPQSWSKDKYLSEIQKAG